MSPTQIVPGGRLWWWLRFVKLGFIHSESWLGRLLLNNKEPSFRLMWRLTQCLCVSECKAEKRDVGLKRAAEKRWAFIL